MENDESTKITYEQALEMRKVFLIGEINYDSYIKFMEEFMSFELMSNDPIQVIINSCGGDIYCTMGIFDKIVNSPCIVTTRCYGQCASGGSMVMQAGDVRLMSPNSSMMIHFGIRGFSGTAIDFRSAAKHEELISKQQMNVYLPRMKGKQKIKRLEEMLRTDTYFTAEEALKLGFIDEIEYPSI